MSEVLEKLGALTEKVKAAHQRVDKVEFQIREDLKEIKDELKELSAYMHRGKGAVGAIMFLSSIFGAGLVSLINVIFKIH